MILRPYQSAAIEAIYRYFAENAGNPLIVLPTGTGKGLVLASFAARAIADWADTRILIVAHVKELIAQNYGEMIRLWPDAPAGIYSAGLNKRDLHAQILFAGIQSVHKRAYDIQRCDLALIDEAQLIPRTSNTMYRRFLSELATINPHLKMLWGERRGWQVGALCYLRRSPPCCTRLPLVDRRPNGMRMKR